MATFNYVGRDKKFIPVDEPKWSYLKDKLSLRCDYSKGEPSTVTFMAYNLSDRLTTLDARLMVEWGTCARFSVYFDQDVDARSGQEEGTMLELYRNNGRDCLPTAIEGFFCLYWRSYYKDTPYEDALDNDITIEYKREEPKIESRLVSFGEESKNMLPVMYAGSPPVVDTLEHNGILYNLCESAADSKPLFVPLVVRSIFFSRTVGEFVGDLTSASSYERNSLGYSRAYWEKHRRQMRSLLGKMTELSFIEPGAGAGVVASIMRNVIAGDPHPPAYAHASVKTETFAETIARGGKDSVIVCAYIHCFLTAEDLSLLEGRSVVWVDAPSLVLKGHKVGPGIIFANIDPKYYPDSVLGEESSERSSTLYYTENLLNSKGYSLRNENQYTTYLRVMRPWISLHLLPDYTGGMRGGVSDCGYPILCGSIKDVIESRQVYPDRDIYFTEIGRVLTAGERMGQLISPDADLNYYLRYRALYRIPLENVITMHALSYLPGCADDKFYYCYNRANEESIHNYSYRDSLSYITGQVFFYHEEEYNKKKEYSMNSRERVYVSVGRIKISFNIKDKDIVAVSRILRHIYPDIGDPGEINQLFDVLLERRIHVEHRRSQIINAAKSGDTVKWKRMLASFGT